MLRLNGKERTDIAILIRENAKLENGLCVYNEGWSDERVLKEFGGRATIESVRSVRRLTFGNVKSQPTGHTIPKDKKIHDRLDAVENRLAVLEAAYSRL